MQPALASYSSPFFQVDPARDGVVFTSDAGGVTTENSGYPRSELREMNGAEKAEWSNRSGAHTLEVRQAVIALPPVKPEVVTAQIHDAEDDVIEIRLEDNRLIAQYARTARTSSSSIPPTCSARPTTCASWPPPDVSTSSTTGALRAGRPSRATTGTSRPGSYLQSNVSKGDAADAIGQVVLYALRVSHTG